MRVLVGQTLDGKYRIVRSLGAGGMGEVYQAVQLALDRNVAIKVLLDTSTRQEESVARFQREARAAAAIGHPNIIQIFDVGRLPDGAPYLVMEFLEGESLAAKLERLGRIPVVEAAGIAVSVLSGLSATHAKGILHRDLKPDNIFLASQESGPPRPVILDFGISKLPEVAERGRLTTTGVSLGTPSYMSPEQATGERDLGPEVDIYSMGVILFECLTGTLPFSGDNYNQLVFRIATQPPPTLRSVNGAIPPAVEAVVLRAMAKEPVDRFSTARALAEELFPFCSASQAAAVRLLSGWGDVASQMSACEADSVRAHTSHSGASLATGRGSHTDPSSFSVAASQAQFLRGATGPLADARAPLHAPVDVEPSPTRSTQTATPVSWASQTSRRSGGKAWGLPVGIGLAVTIAAIAGGVLFLGVRGDSGCLGRKAPSSTTPATAEPTSRKLPSQSQVMTASPDSLSPTGAPPEVRASALPSGPPDQSGLVPVRITVEPRSASIYLDGLLLPGNPYQARLASSTRTLHLVATATGYREHSQPIRLTAPIDLTLRLEPLANRARHGGRRERTSAPSISTPPPMDRQQATRPAPGPQPRRRTGGRATIESDVPF